MKDVNYNLYYAQITPSIGYKLMKRLSVGVGPDFQKMLVDNRPATSEVDRGNLQVAPTFDVGFVGKTEVALTQRVRAGVSYRKGINGVINLSDKFIDRDYVQFQMRCTIFNR
jgi:long-subunit fatty acid transport protein